MNGPTLEELLANVLRNTGWIMAGGSAQFRHAALAELQSSLHLVHQQARTERVLQSVNVLDEKATKVAANNASNTESVMGLRRVLGEFEHAMKAYLASVKRH
jgi:hypothetical protein